MDIYIYRKSEKRQEMGLTSMRLHKKHNERDNNIRYRIKAAKIGGQHQYIQQSNDTYIFQKSIHPFNIFYFSLYFSNYYITYRIILSLFFHLTLSFSDNKHPKKYLPIFILFNILMWKYHFSSYKARWSQNASPNMYESNGVRERMTFVHEETGRPIRKQCSYWWAYHMWLLTII